MRLVFLLTYQNPKQGENNMFSLKIRNWLIAVSTVEYFSLLFVDLESFDLAKMVAIFACYLLLIWNLFSVFNLEKRALIIKSYVDVGDNKHRRGVLKILIFWFVFFVPFVLTLKHF